MRISRDLQVSNFARIGRFAARHRYVIMGLWLIAVLACMPFAPQIATALKPGGFGSNTMESVIAGNLLQNKLNAKFTSVDIFFSSPTRSILDPCLPNQPPCFAQEALNTVAPLSQWSAVGKVVTFFDDPHQISRDGHAAYIAVYLNTDADSAPNYLPGLKARLHPPADVTMSIGGGPVFYADIQTVSESDLRRAEEISFPFALIALLLVFGSVVAAAVPAVIGGCSVVVSLALVYFLALHTTISVFALNITTLFGLGLGVDYSLFMVNRYREELRKGRTVEEAIMRTMETAGRAVTVSGTAVSIGLLGLLLFNFSVLRSIGLGGVLVVVISILAATTLLPAVLSLVGTRINAWPVRLPWHKPSVDGVAHAEEKGFWHRLSLIVMRRPWAFLLPVLAFLILLGTPFLNVRLGAPDASILPKSVPSRAAYDLLNARFDANETEPVILAVQTADGGQITDPANLQALSALVVRLQSDASVRRVDSIVSIDPRITLAQYTTIYAHPNLIGDATIKTALASLANGDTTLVSIISNYSMIDPRSLALVQDIRSTHFPGLKVLVTGGSAGVVDYVNVLYSEFPWAILAVAITTYLVLMLLFQSVVLPLKALAMNTLSILSAYGALVFVFQEGHLSGLLNFAPLGFVEASAPILMFCALFGLSMDYEVFLLSRVREEYLVTGDNTRSVALGMERSGAIITSAAAIVVIVSGAFITADMILVKEVGVGMALAVLMDATLVRGLLVPATMRLLGDWNWWWPFRPRHNVPPSASLDNMTPRPSVGAGSAE